MLVNRGLPPAFYQVSLTVRWWKEALSVRMRNRPGRESGLLVLESSALIFGHHVSHDQIQGNCFVELVYIKYV